MELPFISVICPTGNRRKFIPLLLKFYRWQDYKGRKELIILDDGKEDLTDLIPERKDIKYHKMQDRVSIGVKRNLLHKLVSLESDIIACMDDDDYYGPHYLSEIAKALPMNDDVKLVCGCRYIYLYDTGANVGFKLDLMSHCSSNATFAYKKEALEFSEYNPSSFYQEEKDFVENFYQMECVELPNDSFMFIHIVHWANTTRKMEILSFSTIEHEIPTDIREIYKPFGNVGDKRTGLLNSRCIEHINNIRQKVEVGEYIDYVKIYEQCNPIVSIVMTTHNRVKQTINSLISIERQNIPVEVIIVDDSQLTKENLRKEIEDHKFSFNIKYIAIKKNYDYISSLVGYNIGFKFVVCDIVIIQNAEIFHLGNIIEKMMNEINDKSYIVCNIYNHSKKYFNEMIDENVTKIKTVEDYKDFMLKRHQGNSFYEKDFNISDWYSHGVHRNVFYYFLCCIKKSNLIEFDYDFSLSPNFDDNSYLDMMVEKGIGLKRLSDEYMGIHQWHSKDSPTEILMDYETKNLPMVNNYVIYCLKKVMQKIVKKWKFFFNYDNFDDCLEFMKQMLSMAKPDEGTIVGPFSKSYRQILEYFRIYNKWDGNEVVLPKIEYDKDEMIKMAKETLNIDENFNINNFSYIYLK